MNRLTNEQRLQIIEFYYQNDCSVRKVHRALLPFYGQFSRPTEAAIRALVLKFRTKFTLLDIKPPQRLRRARTEENIAAVSDSVNDDHQLSIRRRSQQLGLCYSTTLSILRKDLNVKPFKTHEEEQQVEGTVASVDDAETVAHENDKDNNDDDAEEKEEQQQQAKKQTEKQEKKQAEKQVQKKAEQPAETQAEKQAKNKVEIQAKKQAEKPVETQAAKQVKKKAEKQQEEDSPPKRKRGRATKK